MGNTDSKRYLELLDKIKDIQQYVMRNHLKMGFTEMKKASDDVKEIRRELEHILNKKQNETQK